MSPKGIISTMAVEDAVNMLSAAEYGIHCLIVYPDLTTLREFYSRYIQRQVEDRNESVKMASFYETLDSVRRTLSKVPSPMDVERLERENTLAIDDSLNGYFADGEYVKFDLDAYKIMVGNAKALGKRGALFWEIPEPSTTKAVRVTLWNMRRLCPSGLMWT